MELNEFNGNNLKMYEDYPSEQKNGQYCFGPPLTSKDPPPRGTEIFVGKLPRECSVDDLLPIFAELGLIYEIRLMMEFSGLNRGFAFVRYFEKKSAANACKALNNFPIRQGEKIMVGPSVDNCRLFVGGIPRKLTKKDVLEGFKKAVGGVRDVLMYPCSWNKDVNRGFAFVEFESHRDAAVARRSLVQELRVYFGPKAVCDWAEPEPPIEDDVMRFVCVLYLRNLNPLMTEEGFKVAIFQIVNKSWVEKVKKIRDFAFIHFITRAHAEKAFSLLKGLIIEDVKIEVRWSRPPPNKPSTRNKFFGVVREVDRKNMEVLFNEKTKLSSRRYQPHPSPGHMNNYVDGYQHDSFSPGYMHPVFTSNVTNEANHFYHPEGGQFQVMTFIQELEDICKSFGWLPPQIDCNLMQQNTCFYYAVDTMVTIDSPLATAPYAAGPFTATSWSREEALNNSARTALLFVKNFPGMNSINPIYPSVYDCKSRN